MRSATSGKIALGYLIRTLTTLRNGFHALFRAPAGEYGRSSVFSCLSIGALDHAA